MDRLPRAIIVASFLLASAIVGYGWMVRPPKYSFRVADDTAVWVHDTRTGAICFAGFRDGAFLRRYE